MKIKNLLEGLSPILYHTTSIKSALTIMNNNQFLLSSDNSGRESDISGGSIRFWMSTARSMRNSFSVRIPDSITFILDGTKLSSRYSGGPTDYFSGTVGKTGPQYDEMEDRIYSASRSIPKALNYITGVVFNSSTGEISKSQMNELKEIWSICVKNGISFSVLIKFKKSNIKDLVLSDTIQNDNKGQDLPDPSSVIDAIIKASSGYFTRFSQIKSDHPDAVKYLIGQNPKEFSEKLKSLLSTYSKDKRIDPLIEFIKNKFNRSVDKLADTLFQQTNII